MSFSIRAAALAAATALFGCATPSPPVTQSDCRALLSDASAPIDLDGAWIGTAASQDMTTAFELRVANGSAFATMADRYQYNAPVRAALSDDGRTLCLTPPYRPSAGVITLHRDRRGWRGEWSDPQFTATVVLARSRAPDLPRARELNFVSSDGAQLAGTLVLPPRGRGPFTTIVWVHGSAPTTRDTWFYRGRAHRLAREGFASLIWDKRGSGASTGEQAWSIDRLSLDAQAAIEAARAAPEVADDGVIIAGASQGGWIAPRVAADNQWLAGVMVFAAPGITIAEQNLYSFERALQREGVPPDLITSAVSLVRDTYEYYRTGEGYDALRARLEDPTNSPIVSEAFFRNMLFQNGELPGPGVDPTAWQFMFVDYLEYWRRVDQPVLSMWGADDNEVPATLSRERISEALGLGGMERTLLVFEDATHSLYVDRDANDSWDWERTAPGFDENVLAWLQRRH